MIINHLGLIPDGNRRWAVKNGKDLYETYVIFFDNICSACYELAETQVNVLSVYVLSYENLLRSNEEIDAVFRALSHAINTGIMKIVNSGKFVMKFVGDQAKWPEYIKNEIKSLEVEKKEGIDLHINFLLGYNPFFEINEVIKDKSCIEISDLLVNSCVDLIIRTGGGTTRLSNFLPLQSGYSAIHVVDSFFNDFGINEYSVILDQYLSVKMRYGK